MDIGRGIVKLVFFIVKFGEFSWVKSMYGFKCGIGKS